MNKATLQTNGFSFQPGDSLKISGYTGSLHTYFFSSPLVNTDYIIPFGMNFPCPSEISFSYGGQTYNTVQIGNQCWMKENLNIGTMVQSIYTGPNPHSNCSDNGIIEKYCYNNDDLNCNLYGGWYDWSEMMGYSTLSGTQGICPSGWHIPMDVEWQVLNDYLGGDVVAGGKMKESGFSSWLPPNTGASNISGFTALGSGYRLHYGNFSGWNQYTSFWSSTEYSAYQAWFMYLVNDTAALTWTKYNNTYGFPVRCLKNE
ncbi:MAG: hypothetical protein NTU44_14360 [Bacteroidetes bacterium]|nr:hypothetical protein [Bacteroidota bacterium]